MSEFETLLNALLNGETVDIVPQSRMEQYLKNCCDKCGCDGLPAPESRAEILLYQLAEQLKNGGGGGDSEANAIIDGIIDGTLSGEYYNDRLSTKIKSRLFENSKLTKATFTKVGIVDGYAFQNSTSLTELVLPSCTIIASSMCYGCSSLKKVIIGTNKKTVCTSYSTSTFKNTPIENGTGFIYVPDDLVEQYKVETNWALFASQIKGISELEG